MAFAENEHTPATEQVHSETQHPETTKAQQGPERDFPKKASSESPQEKEKNLIQSLLKKIQRQLPEREERKASEFIAKMMEKNPSLTSAFLSDLSEEAKSDFPYDKAGKKWPLGQEKRYGNWKLFDEEFQKLTQCSHSNEFQQQLARCFDLWKSAWTEHARGSQNDKRVQAKQEEFLQKMLLHFPEQKREEREQKIKQKRAEQGTLTFEVFLDDIAKNPEFLKGKSLTFSNVYAQRESRKIQQLGQKNMDIKTFEKALQLSWSNNEALKKNAETKIKELREKKLSTEQLSTEIENIYREALTPAVESYGMLNREEVIKTAFVGLKPQDYKQWGLFFKKIQIIGKHYYNYDQMSIDGLWGPQTEAVLLSLRSQETFSEYWAIIDSVLEANISYGEKAKKLSNQLIEQHIPGLFDQINPRNGNSSSPQEDQSFKTHQERFIGEHQNKNLNQSLDELSDEEIESSIPREDYLATLTRFLKSNEENFPDQIKHDPLLAQKILDDIPWDEEWLEAIKTFWAKSEAKKELLASHKNKIGEYITQQAGITAIQVRENLLQEFWIHIDHQEIRKNAQNQSYFLFEDRNAPGNFYTFNPITWEIASQKNAYFEAWSKSIDFSGKRSEVLCRIPSYAQLIDQASNVSSYLPERPLTKSEFEQQLNHALKNKIHYHIGDTEKTAIRQNIEKSQLESDLLQDITAILEVEWSSELTQEKNKAYYEIIVPLLNTVNHASHKDLIKLKAFIHQIKDYLWSNDDLQKKENDPDNPILQVLAHPHSKKHLQKEGNNKHKTEFWLGILFTELEKLPPWAEDRLENKVLDLEKIDFLNTSKTKEELYNHSRFWSWYRKTAESISQYGEQQEIEFLEQKMSSAYQQTENLT